GRARGQGDRTGQKRDVRAVVLSHGGDRAGARAGARGTARGPLGLSPLARLPEEIPGALGDVLLWPAGRQLHCSLSSIPLTACEIEVVVELARVRLELRPDEDEPVGLEEVAKVGVGKRPGVRRIACALEAIELERRQRIDRRDLIVD